MRPHGLLSGTCKHGENNYCSRCYIETLEEQRDALQHELDTLRQSVRDAAEEIENLDDVPIYNDPIKTMAWVANKIRALIGGQDN